MLEPCFVRSVGISTRSLGRQFAKKPFVLSRANSTAAETITEAQLQHLTWPQYLAIRRSKRTWQTAVTIPCALIGFGAGAAYFATMETDPLKPIFGVDPFFFYGFCTVGCLGAGWLAGPTLGTALWRMTHRSKLPLIDARDREFYQRIAKNRVDASLQSPTAPVPDYYGERVGSLHQYRQWLRDQGKYRRKALLPENLD
ncbi:mitochondrial import protein Pam17 [Crucibulum laeve]|uniref:Presequence translocated-associated motor subunit PAM17 n=1 Tax=Crucibulum laeve TaxID=68775 RepID=A0A5C3LU87_9AGAR|nr:mitochondrial import protein Pam17 [Crucibulum laeve]